MKSFLKKHKKKLIVFAIILILLLLIGRSMLKAASTLPQVDATVLQVEDLVNSVNVTGTVESENSKKIFTQLALPVLENHVEVGDKVKEGDVLCELDVDSIQNTIAQQKAAAGAQSALNSNTIAMAEKQHDTAQADLEKDKNATILQAEQALEAAKSGLNQAEVAYEGAVDSLQNARKIDRYTDEGYADYKDPSYVAALNQRDSAYASYESAKQGVIDAESSLDIAKNSVEHQIDGYSDSITSSKIAAGSVSSQWIAIENLEKDLGKAVITSPINGVVTAVYVTEGATSTGLLYVVEDIDDLKIKATLKEYDLTLVKEGHKSEIKSDATGDDIFDGKVTKISPTTIKTATGDNQVGVSGEFETEIDVTDKAIDLKIGTKARVDIIYERKDNVLTVPFEAVGVDENGKTVIYKLEKEANDVYVLKAVPIETGMEGDFKLEILGGVKEGDIILSSTTDAIDGKRVNLSEAAKMIVNPQTAEGEGDKVKAEQE